MEHSTYFQSFFVEQESRFAEREAALREEANQRVAEAVEQARRQAIARGFEQGERRGAIDALMALLASRFNPAAVQALLPTFENVKELERLKQLFPAAVQAPDLEAFLQHLAE